MTQDAIKTPDGASAAASHVAGEESFRFSAVELMAGATAGFAEHFVMFPFDTIKTRMQSGKVRSMRDAGRHLGDKLRIGHLYRGCVPVLVAAVPAHAVYFGTYEAAKRVGGEGPLGIAVSAGLATVAHDTVSTPFDVIKQRMQMDGSKHFKNSLVCMKHVASTEGINSLFVSLPTTIAMNVPHFAAYWLVYESIMRACHGGQTRSHEEEVTVEYMGAGFAAGAVASVVSFPFDIAKTRLQLGYGTDFSSIMRDIVSSRGIRGVFTGVLPRVIYTAPSGAIMMVTYETTKNLLATKETQA